MNEDLRNLLNEIENVINEIGQMYERGPIYSSRDGIEDMGNQVVYTKNLSNGIDLRLLNDGSYSIGGNATEEEKRNFIASLEGLVNENSGEVSQEIKDAIYPIIDAVEISIENPERDSSIEEETVSSKESGKEQEETQEEDSKTGSKDDSTKEKDGKDEEDGKSKDEETSQDSPELEEYRKKLEQDLKFMKDADSTLSKVREEYLRKAQTEGKDNLTVKVFIISTANLLNDLKEVSKKIEETLKDSRDKKEKIDINYDADFKDILIRIKKDYGILKKAELDNLSPEFRKEYEDLMKQVDEKMKELGLSSEEKDNGEKDGTSGKLKVVFDAKAGRYFLYEGDKVLSNVNPDDVFAKAEEDKIYEIMQKDNPGLEKEDLYNYIDPVVYGLLSDYDKGHKTNYANEFVHAVMEKDLDSMPIELKYLLSRKNNLDKGTYSEIKGFAKQYDREGLATKEKIKKEKEEASTDKEDNDTGKKKSLWESIKYLGVGLISALVNAAYNIKDVVTGKKKFKELVPPNLFKRLDGPEVKFLPKSEKKKESDKDTKDTKDTDATQVLPKVLNEKKVSIAFVNGQYALKTGKEFDSPIRYGDIVIKNIDPVSTDVLKEFKLSAEEEKRVDPTVYKALVALEGVKKYQGIADRYVESARKGESLPGLSIGYDLTTIDAIDSKYLSDDRKSEIKNLAKVAQGKSKGDVVMPSKSLKPETVRSVNEDIANSHLSMDYDKLGYVKGIPSDIYSKMDLDMAVRAKKVLKQKIEREGVTDQKAELEKTIVEMAKARGIIIKPDSKLTTSDIFAEIIVHDSDMLAKDASYLMPEEKARANTHRDSSKGKNDSREADKEEVK